MMPGSVSHEPAALVLRRDQPAELPHAVVDVGIDFHTGHYRRRVRVLNRLTRREDVLPSHSDI